MAQSLPWVLQNAVGATGDGTEFRLSGLSTALFDVAISASATVTFEAAGTLDTWVSLPCENIATGAVATTTTASGLFRADVRGLTRVRARVSTFGSGTITVHVMATDAAANNNSLSGVGALTIGKAEDAAHASGDVGVPALTVRQNTAAALSGSDADYQPLISDGSGRVWAHIGAIDAGETHIGEVAEARDVLTVTPVCDTSALASGDLIADAIAFTGVRATNGRSLLESLAVIDEDDQGAAFDIYFMSGSGTFGTLNSAPSISDANAREFLGIVSVATGDYKDLGGVRVASFKNIGLQLEAATGTTNVYLALVNGAGTPTYTASGIKLRLGLKFS